MGDGKLGGVFWGVILGLVLWSKWWGLSIGSAVGSLGLDDEFVREVGDAVGKGSSALFVIAEDDFVDQVQGALAEGDPEVMAADLEPEDVQTLKAIFGTG